MKKSLRTPRFIKPVSLHQVSVPVAVPPVASHPCVQPRRRFILRFLACCAGLTVLGSMVAVNRFESPENVFIRLLQSVVFPVSILFWLLPVYLPLMVRSYTPRGSLLQLMGCVLPLMIAMVACSLCWGAQSYSLAFSMGVVLLALGSALFVLLPGYLIHMLLSFLERRCRQ